MTSLIWLFLIGCNTSSGTGTGLNDTGPPPNCDQLDEDGDGVDACTDCDDLAPTVFPGADELCDGLDNDCDGLTARNDLDADSDGALDCATCDAAGFWRPTHALDDANQIRTTLKGLTNGLSCTYGDSTRSMFLSIDKVDGQVEGVYTGIKQVVGNNKPDPTLMNTEHTWPQSLGASELPAKCDIHHLYPANSAANSARSNYPFGVVSGPADWSVGGSALGDNDRGERVFEPRDVHKGNVARSMFYFAWRYNFPLSADQRQLFLKWSHDDPVDATEAARTLSISRVQNHANPYVACLNLADRVE